MLKLLFGYQVTVGLNPKLFNLLLVSIGIPTVGVGSVNLR